MSSKPPNGTPKAAEFGQLRAYLSRKKWSQDQIDQAVGIKPNGRTRAEIADELKEWINANN